MEEYSKEQLWELYEQLPEDLQKAVFSEETGSKIENILKANNIKNPKKSLNIIKNIGYVFLGLLPPNELKENVLKKDFKIKDSDAENIFSAINNEIFLELRKSLEALYGIKLKEKKSSAIKNNNKPSKRDGYREPLE